MKKISSSIAFAILFTLSGCFDTVQETTINNDGSGTYVNTIDMGKLLGMAKMMGGDKQEMKDLDKMKMDTVVYLKDIKDSLKNLSEAEKKLLSGGSLKILMNMPDEKFSLTFSFPYSQPADLMAITDLMKKTKQNIMSDQLDKLMPADKDDADTAGLKDEEMTFMGGGLGKDSNNTEVEDYYKMSYEKGRISKKLNKEMYAKIDENKSISMLREMSQMGISSTLKTVINLPKPAKKAEGKGVKLSEDKKKVTIEGTLDDFFEDPSQFEYNIEY